MDPARSRVHAPLLRSARATKRRRPRYTRAPAPTRASPIRRRCAIAGEHRRTESDLQDGAEDEDLRLRAHRQAARPNGPPSRPDGPAASKPRDLPFASGATGRRSLRRSSAWLRPPNACENSGGIRKTLLASPRRAEAASGDTGRTGAAGLGGPHGSRRTRAARELISGLDTTEARTMIDNNPRRQHRLCRMRRSPRWRARLGIEASSFQIIYWEAFGRQIQDVLNPLPQYDPGADAPPRSPRIPRFGDRRAWSAWSRAPRPSRSSNPGGRKGRIPGGGLRGRRHDRSRLPAVTSA